MTDSRGSIDSPQGGTEASRRSYISEDPHAKDHLEALFEVIHTGQPGAKPMKERELPTCFFNQPSAVQDRLLLKHRLGPSITVSPGVAGMHHLRSVSLPVNIEHGHGRQYSDSAMTLPAGWELARTPEGVGYYIE